MNSLLTRHKLEQEVEFYKYLVLTNRVINLPTYDPKSKMQSGCNHCIFLYGPFNNYVDKMRGEGVKK